MLRTILAMIRINPIGTLLSLLLACLALSVSPTATAQDLFGSPTDSKAPAVEPGHEVEASFAASRTTIHPGDTLTLAFIMDHATGWHSWPSIDQDVLPKDIAEFTIRTEAGLAGPTPDWIAEVGPVQWPEPHLAPVANIRTGVGTMEVYTYQGRAIAYLPIIIADDVQPGEYKLDVRLLFQTCDESVCLAPRTETQELTFTVIPAGESSADDAPDTADFADFDQSIFGKMRSGEIAAAKPSNALAFNAFGLSFELDPSGAAGFALLLLTSALGGFLLNLTPCVLPVIPLKIMGLSQSAGNPRRTLLLGSVMSLGVVMFWMGIGLAIAFLSGFDSISSLFQTSWFALAVGLFIATMGVGMLGLFTVKLPNAVYMINPSHDSLHGSFLFGIMTAVLATPCTAPFMGTAAGWAVTQDASVVLLTFAAIGLGMALPYLLLSANPKWIEKIPRTGPASELVKQVMGMLMLAVAVFFVGTGLSSLLAEPGRSAPVWHWWAIAGLLVAAMGWMALQTFRITPSLTKRVVFTTIAVVLSAGAVKGGEILTRKPPIDWITYSPEVFIQARQKGDIILIDFTAEWCLNCKALERGVLFNDRVVNAIEKYNVVPIKIDLTGDNPDGKAFLQSVGRVAIPLLAIFDPDDDTPWLSDSYTIDQVVNAIDQAQGQSNAQ